MKIILERFYLQAGTIGIIQLPNGTRVNTVERPWIDNTPFVSCIPEGTYECVPRRYNRGGYPAIGINNVPGRTHILFHRANYPHQLAGCIAPNSEIVLIGDLFRGKASRTAMSKLMLAGTEFELVIREYDKNNP